ncbi:hypothetical protein LXL04_001495 [Taraxacum kok-saghyz]
MGQATVVDPTSLTLTGVAAASSTSDILVRQDCRFVEDCWRSKKATQNWVDLGAVCFSIGLGLGLRPQTRSVVRAFDSVHVMSDHGLGPTFCLGLGPPKKIAD